MKFVDGSIPARLRAGGILVAAALAVALAFPPAFARRPGGEVDRAASRVYVFVGKKGLGHDHAVEGMLSRGQVRLGATEGAGLLEFDMRSFRADTPAARNLLRLGGETDAGMRKQVDDNMLGPAVLDVAKHPSATFEIRSALPSAKPAAAGKTAWDLVGVFTLHGVSRPLAVRAEAESAGAVDRLWGSFTIKQTDFGIRPFSKLGGVVGIADELRIYGDIRLAAEADR